MKLTKLRLWWCGSQHSIELAWISWPQAIEFRLETIAWRINKSWEQLFLLFVQQDLLMMVLKMCTDVFYWQEIQREHVEKPHVKFQLIKWTVQFPAVSMIYFPICYSNSHCGSMYSKLSFRMAVSDKHGLSIKIASFKFLEYLSLNVASHTESSN